MRLIDADALNEMVDKINDTDYGSIFDYTAHREVRNVLRDIKHLIDNTLTIEAEPVRHGEWVTDDLGRTHCSRCHKRLPYFHCYNDEPNSDWDEEWDEEIPETRYCPNCGAKMSGGASDAEKDEC